MSARIVDGDSLWRSKKIKSVPEKYRADYAWLLAMAEANGTFEADPERVWADAYSFNRPDVTVEMVAEMLIAFEQAGMLSRWTEEDKTYGFFNGMEKAGRLPPASRREKYTNLPPNPPPEIFEQRVQPKQLPYLKMIPDLCRKIIGVSPEREDYYKHDLKNLAQTYGGTKVVEAFERWAGSVKTPPRSPIREFLKIADGLIQDKVLPDDPALDALCVSLYHIGSKTFDGKYRPLLNLMLNEFNFSEIEKAYKEFISTKDDYEMKFAVRDFVEGAGRTIILANRQKQDQLERQNQMISEATQQMQAEAARELNRIQEEEIEEHL